MSTKQPPQQPTLLQLACRRCNSLSWKITTFQTATLSLYKPRDPLAFPNSQLLSTPLPDVAVALSLQPPPEATDTPYGASYLLSSASPGEMSFHCIACGLKALRKQERALRTLLAGKQPAPGPSPSPKEQAQLTLPSSLGEQHPARTLPRDPGARVLEPRP